MTHYSEDGFYSLVWQEEQNVDTISLIRALLGRNQPVLLVLQPGDATRYEFLLTPAPTIVGVSNEGRAPDHAQGRSHILYVAVLEGLGMGVAAVRSGWDEATINALLDDTPNFSIRNPCTRRALAATLATIWSQ